MCTPSRKIKFCTCDVLDIEDLTNKNYWIYKREKNNQYVDMVIGEILPPIFPEESYSVSELMLTTRILNALFTEELLDVDLPPNVIKLSAAPASRAQPADFVTA